jgi:hypothetical protein
MTPLEYLLCGFAVIEDTSGHTAISMMVPDKEGYKTLTMTMYSTYQIS